MLDKQATAPKEYPLRLDSPEVYKVALSAGSHLCPLRVTTYVCGNKLNQVHGAEVAAPPPLGRKVVAWTPPVATQLRALSGRALRDVARDPYLAALHLVLTPLVGLLVGSLFGDLRRYNEETAGVQVRVELAAELDVTVFKWKSQEGERLQL